LITAAVILLFMTITVPADVTIDAETISLGALIPLPPSDPRALLTLGYAPNPGVARRVPKTEILNKIAKAGLSADDLVLPDSILVRRRAAGLDRDQVTRAILEAFINRFPGANVEITNVEIPAVQIGTGAVELRASLPARIDPATPVFVRVDLRGTSFAKAIFVRTAVQIEADQPVLKNRVAAHTEVRPDDIERKMMPVHAYNAPQQIDGMAAKRDLEPGQVLTSNVLYVPTLVRKGDSVTVRARAGAVTVAATMRARAAGKLGETIPVEHLNGEGTTSALIVGPRTLEVTK
jgi:flagella basal body P-ring formation protein FlgA